MGNSFLGLETLSRSLYGQQINQSVIASNLSKTYVDSNGYLVASRQQVNMTTANPLSITTANGTAALGQGPQIQQITRIRNFYLDVQIQKESQVVGYNEVQSNVLTQLQTILNTTGSTISGALTNLASAFTALSVTPLSVGLRTDVVNAGTAFADMARQQFSQLESVQLNLNDQVGQTVDNINAALKSLSSINTQILNSPGAPANDLLDARDYQVTILSRMLNVSASYGIKGTVNLTLNGITLVNNSGAAQFDTNLINPQNPPLSDVRLQTVQGQSIDANTQITGGTLGGLLNARDVVVESYKNALDESVHSVINVTNTLHQSGYAADGTTTEIPFFTGVSARDINVNSSLTTDPTAALVAASSRYGNTANGQVAAFLGDLPNLQANNMMLTATQVNGFSGKVDPTSPMASAATTALNVTGSNSINFSTLPINGSFTVNSVVVNFTNANSIYDVLDTINSADPNVHAVFNYTEQKIYMLSNNTITVNDGTGNFKNMTYLSNQLSSTVRMNNGFSPSDILINPAFALNAQIPALGVDNVQAFKVAPGTSGTILINGIAINWNSNQSLNQIMTAITFSGAGVAAQFSTSQQSIILTSKNPIQIIDQTGNFTAFTGLNGTVRLGTEASAVSTRVASDLASATQLTNQSQAALTQLQNAQDANSAVSFASGDPGVSYDQEMADSVKSMVAYNAALQALQIQDKMLSDLVDIVGGAPNNVFATH